MRNLVKILPYSEVNFRWVSNHYDAHLSGTCIYNDELHEFENELTGYDFEKDDWEEMFVKIYELDFISKLKWRWRQWKFEKCVGYHYTYPNRKNGVTFYYRKPEWLYIRLLNWYYKRKY